MESLKWQVEDLLGLLFQAEAFGAILEKGTMDALFVQALDPNPVDLTGFCVMPECQRLGVSAAVRCMLSLKWQLAEMLALAFQATACGAVIKKGTMDVLFVDKQAQESNIFKSLGYM